MIKNSGCKERLHLSVFTVLLFQQFPQPSYGYNLSQPQTQQLGGQSTFGQPNTLFMPTTIAQPPAEMFQPSQLTAQYQARNQPYGQTTQNTIMVSSATSSLMSTTIKPPNQNAYGR